MTTETQHADEIAAMRQRRTEITAERASLQGDPANDARVWAIELELDSMDDRLEQLGLPLDTVA